MSLRAVALVAVLAAACGGGESGVRPSGPNQDPDASAATGRAERADAGIATDAAPVVFAPFRGRVAASDGPVATAAVTLLAPLSLSTMTDANGIFVVDVPVGAVAVVKVEAPSLWPTVRAVADPTASQLWDFYLVGAREQGAARDLGLGFDATMGLVCVLFRNAPVAGYGLTLVGDEGRVVTPGFGIAYDRSGRLAQRSFVTVAAIRDGPFLLLGNVPPGTYSVTPVPPPGAPACTLCDAATVPVLAGTTTVLDIEADGAGCP